MGGSYFTVDFEMGKIVVYTGPGEDIRGVGFDLWGKIGKRPSGSPMAGKIAEYSRGRKVPLDADVDLAGESPFRRRVYQRVRKIPYGQTMTYGEVAGEVGCPEGTRAVGQAMAANRFPLIIPCHRVVSGKGGVGGFSSGVELKKYLLRLEGVGS